MIERWPGPPADETCSPTRVVQASGVELTVWTCTSPEPTWRRNGFWPDRFFRDQVDLWWPGAVAAYCDGPGLRGCVHLAVYDGGPPRRRRRRARAFDPLARNAWLFEGIRLAREERERQEEAQEELLEWMRELAGRRAPRGPAGQVDGSPRAK